MTFRVFIDILVQASNSFFQITAFLGFVLLLFGYIDYTQQGKLIETITRSRKLQPLIGALLGIFPGCGGSILIMPLYVKGTVTFGTVIATTIATFGDAAFVILTQAPRKFLIITLINFFMGTLAGYLIDYLQTKYKMPWAPKKSKDNKLKKRMTHQTNPVKLTSNEPHKPYSRIAHIGHEAGDEIGLVLHKTNLGKIQPWCSRVVDKYYLLFWLAIAIGLIIGILDFFNLNLFFSLAKFNFNIYNLVGLLGTFLVISYLLCSRSIFQGQTHEDVEHKLFSLKETFMHTAKETSFIGTWIFMAYAIYEIIIFFIGEERLISSITSSTGIILVLLGVAIGIIPGCGPQIIFVSIHLKGSLPFAALLANSISQDGDALFPLLALDKRAAFWTSIINSIWALLIGLLAYFIELHLNK